MSKLKSGNSVARMQATTAAAAAAVLVTARGSLAARTIATSITATKTGRAMKTLTTKSSSLSHQEDLKTPKATPSASTVRAASAALAATTPAATATAATTSSTTIKPTATTTLTSSSTSAIGKSARISSAAAMATLPTATATTTSAAGKVAANRTCTPFSSFITTGFRVRNRCATQSKDFAYDLSNDEFRFMGGFKSPMKAVPDNERELLKTGQRCEYLALRYGYSPDDKYNFPEATSWRIGWFHNQQNKQDFKTVKGQ